MTLSEFCERYDLNGSLLESITVNDRAGTVRLAVDFCYWQQPAYDESTPETGMVNIDFSSVDSIQYEGWKICSDEITKCIYDKRTDSFRLDALSDVTYKNHSISIRAASVALTPIQEEEK